MATIEERAKMSLAIHFEESREVYNKEHNNMREWEYGYCQGATEQRKIDIDKACEWLNNYLYCFQNDATDSIEMDALLSQFRKSMEE